MIAASGLTLRAGRRALLQHVSLALKPGEVLVVVGPNGAGKSTLLRALAGELRPAEGSVTAEGRPLPRWHPLDLARRRAVVPQHTALAFPMTAEALVALGRLPWHGTPATARDTVAVRRAMEAAGVSHLAARDHGTLSGGERQRVAVARALTQLDGAAMPSALLLDEPTASLDAGHRAALLRLLRHMAGQGMAVLAVLHDLNEAAFVAHRVAMLSEGRLIAIGAPEAVLQPEALSPVYGLKFRSPPGGGLLPVFDVQP
jgi:iron complex transport system ATP-binding protein